MDPLFLCSCCLIGTVIIFSIALVMGQRRMRQVEDVMRQFADRHGASFTPGNIIYNPCIIVKDGALELRLYAALGGRSDPSHTELRVRLPEGSDLDAASRLSIRPHSFQTRLTVTLGAKPFLTGDQAFDEAFDARGTPDALLRRCLNPEVRRSLLALKTDRPTIQVARKRSWLPERSTDGQSARLRWPEPTMQFIFSTGGLPTELVAWEPRLSVGRLLLGYILNRPAPTDLDSEAEHTT